MVESSFCIRVAALAIGGVLATSAQAVPAPRVHEILSQGHVAGSERMTANPDGSLHVDFTYRDNGRGPDLHEDMAFAADGSLRRYVVSGQSTMGAAVAERFEKTPTGARWKSLADADEVTATDDKAAGAKAYVPVENSGEFIGALARQLLRRPGQAMPVWTGGSATAHVLATVPVRAGDRRAVLDLVAITGLDVVPDYVWLHHDAGRAFFGMTYPGYAEVDAGFASVAPQLQARQDAEDGRERARLAKTLAHHIGDEFVVRDVRVFDAEHAQLGATSDVYVSRGRIALVLPAGSVVHGDDIAVVEGKGRTLLPGLFDMHVHDGPWSGILHLAGGVTTGRDMGNENADLRKLMNDIDRGDNLGERLIAAGFIEGESPFSARTGIVVDSAAKAVDAVDWYAQHGYRHIKLYNSIHPEWVPEITAHAHALGLRVSGHVPAFMHAEDAVRGGFDEIQHINQVTLNFLTGPQDDTRTLLRFELVAQKANAIDLDSDAVNRFVALLKERGTAVDDTAVAFEAMFTQLQGQLDPGWTTTVDHMPPQWQRSLRVNSSDVTPANVDGYRASFAKMLALMKKMHDAGIPLEAGTDSTPGFGLHRELELYVQAGIPAPEALRIATWNGARFTRTLDRYGSIEPGKVADLVLVDGDPTTNIQDIERIALVVKEGTLYIPAELYQALGIKPFAAAPEIRLPAARPHAAAGGQRPLAAPARHDD